MRSRILELYKAKQTVFTAKEIALLWNENDMNQLKSSLKYHFDKGEILRLRKGIYAKTEYDPLEAAVKIYSPSYISFETTLRKEGLIFQHYETIFVASYLSREITLQNGQKIVYKKMKGDILLAREGIQMDGNYFIAEKERAFLDTLYLHPKYYFDNLRSIDWKKCSEIAPIYGRKKMKTLIKFYQKNYA